MRTIGVCAAATALVVALTVPVRAKTETVRGHLIEQMCYLKDKANNAGKDHKMPADTKDCAIACAKNGMPVALLTADGKLYTIAGGLAADKNAKMIPHMSHTVEITGDVTEKDGAMTITAADLKHISAT